jgi:hypothetical protein
MRLVVGANYPLTKITMKTIIDPTNHELVLAQWANTDAKIWVFHVSLKRMAIVLTRNGEPEVLYIVAVGCEHISGPFSWKQANVSIITDAPNQWGEVYRRIIDKQAGFELRSLDVVLARGPAGIPVNPFDNFIGDAPPQSNP